jgi:hypothetical protein
MTDKITLVICTCDDYADAWNPLFSLFKKYWKDFSHKVVLNTETKSFSYPGFDIKSPQLYEKNQNIPWSKRLRETLINCVDTELVLIYLDDFYLQSHVDVDKLHTCCTIMAEDKSIANIQLFPCPPKYQQLEKYPWLVKREKSSPYLMNLQAGLWRKDRLLHFIREHENPWYFERWGSIRARRYADTILCINPDIKDNIVFDYDPSMIGLSKGKWLPKTKTFFDAENIEMDFSKRGIFEDDYKAKMKNNKREYIKSAINIFKSLKP